LTDVPAGDSVNTMNARQPEAVRLPRNLSLAKRAMTKDDNAAIAGPEFGFFADTRFCVSQRFQPA
jgi:hypothetical protein